ncbi:MAG: T9SS type A sorting domain-containing protein [Bacteroidota bacterium]
MRIVTFLLSLGLSLSFFPLSAQNCNVPNGDASNWGNVRLEHPVQNDSLDFFWPDRWSPFIWNGIDDYVEPYLPGANGVGDTAIATVSIDGFGGGISHYFYCESKPTRYQGEFIHEGLANDSLQITLFAFYVDTVAVGISNIDSLLAKVLFDEIDYTEVAILDTIVVGGDQGYESFDLEVDYLVDNQVPNLFLLSFFHYQDENASPGDSTLHAVDNLNFVFGSTSTADQLANLYEVQMFPNPAQQQFQLQTTFPESYSVTILDIQGRRVAQYPLQPGSRSVDINQLSQGVYEVLLRNDRQELVGHKRLMVE